MTTKITPEELTSMVAQLRREAEFRHAHGIASMIVDPDDMLAILSACDESEALRAALDSCKSVLEHVSRWETVEADPIASAILARNIADAEKALAGKGGA